MHLTELFKSDHLMYLCTFNQLVAKTNKKLRETTDPKQIANLKEKRLNYLSLVKQLNESIIEEDYVNDVESFIVDMVVALKGRNLESFPLSAFSAELAKNGLELDQQMLVDFLSNVDGVEQVIPGEDQIVFNASGLERGVSDDEAKKEKDNIKKTAANVAKTNLKKNQQGREVEI